MAICRGEGKAENGRRKAAPSLSRSIHSIFKGCNFLQRGGRIHLFPPLQIWLGMIGPANHAHMVTQKMICAMDHFQQYSITHSPSFIIPPHLHHNFDLLPMQPLPSPPDGPSSVGESYFPTSTISTSGRQRTAQACDKCRERKTKVSSSLQIYLVLAPTFL